MVFRKGFFEDLILFLRFKLWERVRYLNNWKLRDLDRKCIYGKGFKVRINYSLKMKE